jgi:hypothetical protein
MFEEMLDATRDCLSDLARLDYKEDGEEDDESHPGMLSEDVEPGWVVGTSTKTVQQDMDRFRHMHMMIHKLTPR